MRPTQEGHALRVHVAMVIQAYSPVVGGAQRQLAQLLPRLAARGVQAEVVTRWAPGLARRDGAVTRVGAGWGSPAASARFVAAAAAHVVRSRPDVVHAHDLLSAGAAGMLAATAARVPLVAKVASVGPGGDLDVLLRRHGGPLRLAALRRQVDAFACVAPEVAAELVAHGVPAERCVALPNGVDLGAFAPVTGEQRRQARMRLDLPLGEPLVLATGRLRDVKRFDVLARACAHARATLVLVGEGPEAEALDARPGVIVRPAVGDVGPYVAAADVYGSASLTEGLSNAMLEAMACGVPVAAVPASGVATLLGDGGGAVADGTGAGALGEALTGLLDPEVRTQAGVAARAHVAALHDLEGTADRLVELYASLA